MKKKSKILIVAYKGDPLKPTVKKVKKKKGAPEFEGKLTITKPPGGKMKVGPGPSKLTQRGFNLLW